MINIIFDTIAMLNYQRVNDCKWIIPWAMFQQNSGLFREMTRQDTRVGQGAARAWGHRLVTSQRW